MRHRTASTYFLRRSVSLMAVTSGADWRLVGGLLQLTSRDELVQRLRRYTDLAVETVTAIVDYITLGSGDLGPGASDPALQPLIPLDDSNLAISPYLFVGSDFERNLLTLANKIPADRDLLELSNEKQHLMSEQFVPRSRVSNFCPARFPAIKSFPT